MRYLPLSVLIVLVGCKSSPGRTGGTAGKGGEAGAGGVCASNESLAAGTMASVAPIVIRACASSGCHDPIKREHGMDLSTADLIFENWVGKRGIDHCANQAPYRVAPGDPDASFVMKKIRSAGRLCSLSDRMPPSPAGMLTPCEIETIRAWIAAGARPSSGGAGDGGTPPDGSFDGPEDVGGDREGGAGDPDPSVCTATKPCDPGAEICIELEPVQISANCYTRWECVTHGPPDDGTLEHPCPPEIVTFCGCDGTNYEAPYACPNRPYDHVGACADGYSCDAFRVRCTEPPPSCTDGQVPAVVAGCWGPCVPIGMCRCDQNWQCPQRDRYGCLVLPEFRCAPILPPQDAGTDTPAASSL